MSIITRNEVKQLLNIADTDTTKDDIINGLIGPAEEFVFNHTNNSFEVFRTTYYLHEDTISFDAANKKILDSADGFVDAGFVAGVPIRVTDTLLNDGVYRVLTVAAGYLELELDSQANEELKDEAAGEYYLITMMRLPKDVKMFIAKFIEYHFTNDQQTNGVKSESFGSYSVSYADKNEVPPGLLKMLAPYRCL